MRIYSFASSFIAALFVGFVFVSSAHAASTDLSIAITTPVANILKGKEFTYTITVKNGGPNTASSFTVTDALPSGLTFVSGTNCSASNSLVTCSGANLSSGASRSFWVKVSTGTATCNAPVTNSATVSSAMDQNSSNNTSNTVSTQVVCPDFSVSILTPVATVLKGKTLSYTVRVTNNGPFASQSFVMTDEVPSGLTFQSALGCSLVNSVVRCSGNGLSAGFSRNFHLNFSTASAPCGVVKNTAKVTAPMDPNGANDISNAVSTTVQCPATAAPAIVSLQPTSGPVGTSVTITGERFTATNNSIKFGSGYLSGLSSNGTSITFVIPAGLSRCLPETVCALSQMVVLPGTYPVSILNANGTSNAKTFTVTAVSENELTIVQKHLATTDIAVSNEKNINLFRFEAHATNEDILQTGFIFAAATGSVVNGRNYSLWVDTNNDGTVDTILQKGVASVGGTVAFNNIIGGGYIVPATQSVIFEVHTDVASSLPSSTLQLMFATKDARYLTAEKLIDGAPLNGIRTDGSCIATCEMTVITSSTTLWFFRSQGDLFITKSTTPVRSRQLLGGKLEERILYLTLRAEYEDIDVTDLVLTAVGPNASSIGSNVDRIELFKDGETTPFAVASTAGCGTDSVPAYSMCAKMLTQQLVVQEGTQMNVSVRPRMRTDVDGATSGQRVQLQFDAAIGAKAGGLFSSNNLSQNDGDNVGEGEVFIGTHIPAASQTIIGNDNVVVLSKVTSITNASPDANGTAIPTGTQRQIGQFKFSTAAHANTKNGLNKFTLSGIIFNVNATNVLLGSGDQTSPATSDFKIYNKYDATVKRACTVNARTASGSSLLIRCTDISAMVFAEIDPGADATFVLEADVVNAMINNTSNSTLQVALQNFAAMSASSFSPSGSHILWFDRDIVSSVQFLWIEYPETIIRGTAYQN